MRCPYCNYEDTKVVDSREIDEGRMIRRRRECEKCQARFSTKEKIEILKLIVVKKDSQREEYDKDKIIRSLEIATNKRLKENELLDLIAGVETEIFAKNKNQIESREIGSVILARLKDLDEVSYLRYVSVFKSFGSGKRFAKELDKIG
jgi:transcriptional repressor NrdR